MQNPWLPHYRAKIVSLSHQTHQKESVRTQPGHAFLVNQHKLAVHVSDQQTSFWKAEREKISDSGIVVSY